MSSRCGTICLTQIPTHFHLRPPPPPVPFLLLTSFKPLPLLRLPPSLPTSPLAQTPLQHSVKHIWCMTSLSPSPLQPSSHQNPLLIFSSFSHYHHLLTLHHLALHNNFPTPPLPSKAISSFACRFCGRQCHWKHAYWASRASVVNGWGIVSPPAPPGPSLWV